MKIKKKPIYYHGEETQKIEQEINAQFYKNNLLQKFKDIIYKKEKNKTTQIILITGLRGCRKNNIYN